MMRPFDLDNDQTLELMRRAPIARSYAVAGCGNPDCGPHFILLDEAGDPIAQVMLEPTRLPAVCEALVAFCPAKGSC